MDSYSVKLWKSDSYTLEQASIIEFASQFDPQPYHLDRTAGEHSIFGGLCASGWQVTAIATKLAGEVLVREGVPFLEINSIHDVHWKRPAFADDNLFVEVQLADFTLGNPIPECNSQDVKITVRSQSEEIVATLFCRVAIKKSCK